MSRLRFAPFVLAAALVFAACGGSDDGGGGASNDPVDSTPAAGGTKATVTLEDLKFKPDQISIKTGETVQWKWGENVLHNVHSDDFESPNKSDGVFTHTFDKAGTYEYECTLHSGMSGSVEVE